MGSQKKERNSNTLEPGYLLNGRYIITELIKSSDVSRLYRGKDKDSNKEMAIKELLLEGFLNVAEKEQASKQFQMETRILLRLRHANLPKFEDYFESGGKKYLIMEYIDGKKLSDVIGEAKGNIDEKQVYNWAMELCSVLEYLHNRKPNPIIFRGMCPENVILSDGDGKLKLIDFGISKIFDSQAKTLAVAKTAKLYYSPMEQYVAKTDERTDIYSLGATLYFLITKKVPIDAVARTLDGAPLPSCSKFNPDISPALEEIIFKAMELEQSNRYSNITEMKEALKGAGIKEELTDGLSEIVEEKLDSVKKKKTRGKKRKKRKKISQQPTLRMKMVSSSEDVSEKEAEEEEEAPKKKEKPEKEIEEELVVRGVDDEEYEDDDEDDDDEDDDDEDDGDEKGNFFEGIIDAIINFLESLKGKKN